MLYFHNFHHTESQFLDTVVPNLKNSLSIALKHFLPLAGKMVFPLSSALTFSHYIAGEDSVPLTVSVSDSDFSRLTANHPKGAAEFHDLLPQLPPPVNSSESIKFSLMAIRVTLFPAQGVCIDRHHLPPLHSRRSLLSRALRLHPCMVLHHSDGDEHLRRENILLSYDRSLVQDGRSLTTSFWSHVKLSPPLVRPPLPPPACNL